MKRKIILTLATAFSLYLIPIVSLYIYAMNTGLPGRRGGPQDAFRHTFSSALVARYLSPLIVDAVTTAFERDDNSPHDLMDRHNNRIGRTIGLSTEPSLSETIQRKVNEAQINATADDVITILPENMWTNGF